MEVWLWNGYFMQYMCVLSLQEYSFIVIFYLNYLYSSNYY